MRGLLLAGVAWALMPAMALAQYSTRWPANPTCPAPTTFPRGGPTQVWLDTSSGQRILRIEGGVQAGSSANLIARAIQANQPIDQIWLNSPGGDAPEGNQIAQIIRRSGIPVHIPDGFWCVSSCNFIFFGGAIRTVDSGGVFAVHMATVVDRDRPDLWEDLVDQHGADAVVAAAEEYMAQLTAFDIDVIIRMGISRRLLTEVMYAQSASGLRCLTRDEMRRYNVVNVG